MFDFKRENCQEWTTVKFTIYPHMNKTILLGLALAASVSSASAYHADKYDGQFGMSLEGAYGIATKRRHAQRGRRQSEHFQLY